MSDTVTLRSHIKQYFSVELLVELEKITYMNSVDNNSKVVFINQLLSQYNIPYSPLGPGTNRYTVMIEEYAVKIALDRDGKTDNKREFIYSKNLQPYVIKFYETTPNGLVGFCEYVQIFSLDDFYDNQDKMRKILEEISSEYLIGDIGISTKNYLNWGFRFDGSICILDFAYIYSLSFKTFVCTCPSAGILTYDHDYNLLKCSLCGKKHSFKDVRRRISRKQEEDEIGDIKEKGYVLHSVTEEVPLNPKFTDVPKESVETDKQRKKRELDEQIKEFKKKQDFDFDETEQPDPDYYLKVIEQLECGKESENYGKKI